MEGAERERAREREERGGREREGGREGGGQKERERGGERGREGEVEGGREICSDVPIMLKSFTVTQRTSVINLSENISKWR